MNSIKPSKLGSPVVVHFLVRLTAYYIVLFGLLIAVSKLFPNFAELLPFGGAKTLGNPVASNGFEDLAPVFGFQSDALETSIKLLLAILGAILVMLPMTWVYFKIRLVTKLDQSLIQTMLLLPVAVAGVVAIVQNSLALAFSLAGIVAAVRFRNTLKNTGDSLFIFCAIAAGLAAGVRALEIAIVVTLVFNYIFLILWDLDYGASESEKFMNPSDPEPEDETPAAPKEKT